MFDSLQGETNFQAFSILNKHELLCALFSIGTAEDPGECWMIESDAELEKMFHTKGSTLDAIETKLGRAAAVKLNCTLFDRK